MGLLRICKQELLVLHDEDKLQIMSTKPYKADGYPSDYFIIYENQFFKHAKYDDPKKNSMVLSA